MITNSEQKKYTALYTQLLSEIQSIIYKFENNDDTTIYPSASPRVVLDFLYEAEEECQAVIDELNCNVDDWDV